MIATVLNHIVTTMHINRQNGFRRHGPRSLASALLLAGLLLAVFAPTAFAVIGRDWETRNPSPTGETFYSVVSNGTRLVAVGGFGLIATSDDNGATWIERDSKVSADLLSIAWSPSDGGKFMAVGANSAAVTSPDGIIWTPKPAIGSDRFVSVVWTNSVFVAVGSNGAIGGAQQTTNGTTWTRSTPGADPVLQVAAVTGTLFAATTKTILTGTFGAKGLVWAKVAGISGISTSDLPRSLIWTGSRLVLCTVNGGVPSFWTSPNGKVWTAPTTAPTATAPLRLSMAGTEIIGVGPAGDVWTATQDGNTWTQRSTDQGAELFGGTKVGTTLVAVGQGGRIFSITPPGETLWTSRLSTGPVTDILGLTNNANAFVAVGQNFSVTSPNGIAWTNQPQTDKLMRSVAYTGTQYVAVGDGAWTSPDGVVWTETIPAANAGNLSRVIWTGTQVVAVGQASSSGQSRVWIAPDGVSWTEVVMPTGSIKKLNGIANFGSLLVATGDGGLVLTSPDSGLTWKKYAVVLKAGEHFMDTAFGNNLFVAVTNLGGIWTSASGTKWINRKAASSGTLHRVIRAGNQFIAVGDQGKLAYSFGGIEWVITNASSAQSLRDMAFTGTTLAVAGTSGAILTSDGGEPARPTLTFSSAAESGSEGVGTAVLNVTISPPSPLPVSVLFSLSGPATQGTGATNDYTVSTKALKFMPGEATTLPLNITIKQDNLDEVNETAMFVLGAPTGDAGLGDPYVHTLTILDDDQMPTFTVQPVDLLVNTGSTPVLTATVAASGVPGTTLAAQWKKNKANAAGLVTSSTPVVIPQGATFGATIASAALTHAGAYSVAVKNPTGTATSATAQLGVVDNTLSALNLAADATVTLAVKAAGNGLTYQWLKNGNPISNSTDLRITGTTTAKMVIKEMSFGDNATYSCRVTQTTPLVSQSIIGGTTIVAVVVSAPVITATSLPSTTIGEPYEHTVTASGSPTKWVVANLPSGLTFNTFTGTISGKVTEPITTGTDYTDITFTASNILGAGPPKVLTMHVDPLPAGVKGAYTGTIDRNADLNSGTNDVNRIGLGGRVSIDITDGGIYTGTVAQGGSSYPLMGVVTYNPTGPLVHINEVLSGNNVVTSNLSLTINPATRSITGNTNNAPSGALVATFTGWRDDLWTSNPPSATVLTRRTGTYSTYHVPSVVSVARPVGHSVLTFDIANDGLYTVNGRLADGTVYTSTGVMGATGQIPIYGGLYAQATPGALTGTLTVNEVADNVGGYLRNTVTGTLLWSKPDQGANSTTRSYKSGFQNVVVTLNGSSGTAPVKPHGGRYVPPVVPNTPATEYSEFFMGMNTTGANNGRLFVNSLGVDLIGLRVTEMNEVFSVGIGANPTVLLAGLKITQLTLVPSTGRFSGSYTITDQNPLSPSQNINRNIEFFGVVSRDNVAPSVAATWLGRGSILVPRLPEAGLPPTTLDNSPIQSGTLEMRRSP